MLPGVSHSFFHKDHICVRVFIPKIYANTSKPVDVLLESSTSSF